MIKVGGLGWKSKMVVGWALDGHVVDGLVVKTKTGEQRHLTAVMVRDELFNRLVAIGSQMWENRSFSVRPSGSIPSSDRSSICHPSGGR
ncbi:hypothetical protein CDD80_2383 [Ophiocordyceps camponoti-rufipedis]|uniref:Uncharacterized protein n=1 Tax=Ophiocordyceps camponoti-rufipedis TaxID=2004952 RepID=A0A2C5XUV4_9HYPO|nr:hypothetical protein CDD80_2383 [Ophiocordyceps camponoti-rufipedis]